MPVSFRDDDEVDALGSAGFLKIDRSPDGACCLGALFVIDARGIPLEFAYNRVTVPHPFLWREADLRRYVERRLVASLLSVCTHQPRLLLCRADEVGTALFTEDIRVDIPVGLVGELPTSGRRVDLDTGEVLDNDDAVLAPPLTWLSAAPEQESPDERLVERLSARGLLYEPFDRAAIGLREAYG
jgi:hypothetical protein